mmetsp:Transcript_53160/g.159102  ORF Transcript_53160/g.159102 Transcript_53160/m.159102 type:complete len:117 (-) Transcript_53160:695-1045(-)
MPPNVLKTVVFLGSARNCTPPWGGDSRLGDRVVSWVKSALTSRRSEDLGGGPDSPVTHDFHVVDPLEAFGEGGALSGFTGGEMRTPTFFMKGDDLPPATKALQEKIGEADCYIIVR